MNERLIEAAGISPAEPHQLAFMLERSYSVDDAGHLFQFRQALVAASAAGFWAQPQRLDHPTPHDAATWWSRLFPGRPPEDMTAYLQAMWDDGFTGTMIARLLGREPT